MVQTNAGGLSPISSLQEQEPLFWHVLQTNLAPFQSTGVSRQDIDKAANILSASQFKQRVLIYNNELYIYGTSGENQGAENYQVFLKLLCRQARATVWGALLADYCKHAFALALHAVVCKTRWDTQVTALVQAQGA